MADSRWVTTAERFFPKLLKRDRVLVSEVRAAERRLRVSLPAGLTAMYRLAGRRSDLHGSCDRLLPLNRVIQVNRALVFYEEHQQRAAWAIPVERLGEEDPPVVRALNQPPYRWEPDHDSLSGFFFTELVWQIVHAEPYARGRFDADIARAIRGELEPVALSGCHWDIAGVWADEGALLLARGDELYAGGASAEELERITTRVAANWR